MKKIIFALFCAAVFAVSAQAQTVTLSFRNADDTKSVWPFAEKRFSKDAGVTEATLTQKKTDYMFDFQSSIPIYLNSKLGLMFGGAAGNSIKLPVVKGKTLVKVSVKYAGKGNMGRLAVTDAKGNVYEGGDAASSRDLNYVRTWKISGAKKGKPSFLTLTHDSVVKMKEMVLEYE